MQDVTISFTELEALHDVLEAARCYWHQRQRTERAAETLRVANRLYWTIGEYLPKTGESSERFDPVEFDESTCSRLLIFAQEVASDYAKANDP